MHTMYRLDDLEKADSLNMHGAVEDIVNHSQSPSVVSEACLKLIC